MNQLSERHAVWGLAVSSSGQTLFATGACFLSKWDLGSGSRLGSAYVRERVSKAVLSSDESTLFLATSEAEGLLLRYSATTLERLAAIKAHTGFLKTLILLPRSGVLASGSADRTIALWDERTLASRAVLAKHRDWVWALAHDRAEQTLFSGGSDKELLEHSLPRGETLRRVVMPEWVMSVALSEDEQTIYVGGQKRIFFVERKNGKIAKSFVAHNGPVFGLVLERASGALVSCSGDGRVALSLAENPLEQLIVAQHDDQVYAVLLSGDRLISGGCDKRVAIASLSAALGALRGRTKSAIQIEPENEPESEPKLEPQLESEPSDPELKDSSQEAPLRITCLMRPPGAAESAAFESLSEPPAQPRQRLVLGTDWVSGIVREGRLLTTGPENLEQPLFFRGAERLMIGFGPAGLIQTDSGETFEINYEMQRLELRGREDLF